MITIKWQHKYEQFFFHKKRNYLKNIFLSFPLCSLDTNIFWLLISFFSKVGLVVAQTKFGENPAENFLGPEAK
jgi:hypothetical protein